MRTIATGSAVTPDTATQLAIATEASATAYNTKTVRRSDRPIATSLCEGWSTPPRVGLRPAIQRSAETKTTSPTGTTNTRRIASGIEGPAHLGFEPGNQRRSDDDRADEQAAAVAHEHPGGRGVPREKADERAREGDQQEAGCRRSSGRKNDGAADGRDRADAGRQAIHVVEEIEGVHDPGKPGDRQQHERRRRELAFPLAPEKTRAPHRPRGIPRAWPSV